MLDSFSVVGSGAMARTLSHALLGIGVRCNQIVSRNQESAKALALELGAEGANRLQDLEFASTNLLILAVPDDALESVVLSLGEKAESDDIVILHTSGALDSQVLDPLSEKGAECGSFHPLQTFAASKKLTSAGAQKKFKGVTIGIEGSEVACRMATHMADSLLANPVVIQSSNKALYHAAAVMAGNHAITLMAAAAELWEQATGSKQSFSEALGPLILQSISNTVKTSPEAALTGPVARGDKGTLVLHLEAIREHLSHLLPLYGAVATETVHLAMRSGRLSADQAVALLDAIDLQLRSGEDAE